jgi:hypothetical protein
MIRSDRRLKGVFLILASFSIFIHIGCGVKGKPLPPLNPPALGRGEPSLSAGASNYNSNRSKAQKSSSTKSTDDWDESEDFSEQEKQKK